jgi:UDP-N-acetylmuramoyl-L-alanyl-D-glutamate--2,6-diaminopimelate ligase
MSIETLAGIRKRLQAAGLLLDVQGRTDDANIDHLAADSRKVGPGGLFVAVRGAETDGHLFIDKAVQNGAETIVCEAMPDDRERRYAGIAFVRVSDGRAALAELAAAFFGDPSHTLRVVGITGTNGKTTVACLIHHVLTQLGWKTGLVGTIETRIGGGVLAAGLTTPGPIEMQGLLRRMADAGCRVCAMEVSSHALDQRRVGSIPFAVAVFTNLTRDHIDYHGTIAAYRASKKKLFDDLGSGAVAVYNADDAAGAGMVADTPAVLQSFAVDAEADVRVEILDHSLDGLTLQWAGEDRRFRLVGRFNAYNLMAAYAAACALGHTPALVLDALQEAPPVPGRFELMHFDDGTKVVVDYAHTPDALENVLQTIADAKEDDAEVWCVFGCGGDRDRAKRPLMAMAAERYADHVIATSDNPRTEDPVDILEEIRSGFADPRPVRFVPDRREAIAEAGRRARAGDVVLVAGRGHERFQTVGTEKRPFDDREVVREVFASRVLVHRPEQRNH